jgi:signal transduction histidine kinase
VRWRHLYRSPIGLELLVTGFLTVASIAFAVSLDLNERLVLWSLDHPEFEILDLEDLPFAFMFIAIGAAWLAARRWRAYRDESEAHQETLARLTTAMEAAVAANQAKSQFLANMSHELRTPLNAIMGFADIIRLQTFGPDAQGRYQSYANDIHAAGEHLVAVVSDILNMARSDAGTLRFEPTAVDLTRLLDEVQRMIAGAAEEGGLVLEVVSAPGLVAWVDRDRLRQAVLNIAVNAVKFTPHGGRVRMAAERGGDSIVIRVTDTGIGIAAADIPRALAPFEQVNNGLQRRFQGAGLGLPLAKRFVEQQGGRFDLTSEPGAGTVVTIRVPADTGIAAAAE